MADDDARSRISALRNSHDRLVSIIDGLAPDQLTGPSYCKDWTIAQVLSHLGSGAEIFSLMVEAGLDGGDPPGPDSFPPIWDAWNSKSPELQATDLKGADEALVEQIESLDSQQLAKFHLSMFGMEVDAARLIGMRLSEATLHGWDVAVTVDPSAKLAPDATDLLIDVLPALVGRSGRAEAGPMRVKVQTTDPERSFLLVVDESVSLEEVPKASVEKGADDVAKIVLPAEALLRLTAGRLDDGHLPADLTVTGVTLDALRGVFPGL